MNYKTYDRKKKCWVFDIAAALQGFRRAQVSSDGVVRWISNGQVPPRDILEDWQRLHLSFDFEASCSVRERDFIEMAKRYSRNQKAASAEELYEMEAAFGKGTVVVDVISGRRTQL